jgi:hypothetical protein
VDGEIKRRRRRRGRRCRCGYGYSFGMEMRCDGMGYLDVDGHDGPGIDDDAGMGGIWTWRDMGRDEG